MARISKHHLQTGIAYLEGTEWIMVLTLIRITHYMLPYTTESFLRATMEEVILVPSITT